MSDSNLIKWSWHIAGRLAAHPTYGVIPVTAEFAKVRSAGNTFAQQVQTLTLALTGYGGGKSRRGLAIFVKMPHLSGDSNKLGSLTTKIICEVSVCESRLYNANASSGFAPDGVGLHADDAAETLALWMQGWRDYGIADACSVGSVLSDHEGWIPPDLRDGSEKFDLYVTAFQLSAVYSQAVGQRCYPPAITFGGGNCTMTPATSGATIWYATSDSDYPDTLYSVPFTVTSGQTILAVATKTGLQDSDVQRGVAP